MSTIIFLMPLLYRLTIMRLNALMEFCAAAALLFVVLTKDAVAESHGEESELTEPMGFVITATRVAEPLGEVTDRVTYTDEYEIAETPVRDAAEALDYMPGVIMNRTGGVGSVVFPSIQGAESYQTTVLINGIPFSDLANGIGNLGQIPSEQIERIEVIHGAGGSEWGSALGGVINVITHKPDRKGKNYLIAGGGDYATGFTAVNLQLSTKNIAASIGGGKRKTGGPEGGKRGQSSDNFVGDVEVSLGSDANLSLLGYTFQGETGSGGFRSILRGYWENYKYNTSGGGASLNKTLGNGSINVKVFFQNQTQLTEQNMDGVGQLNAVRLEDKILGGSAIWNAELGTADLTLGAEGKNGRLKSSSLLADSYEINTSGEFINLKNKFRSLILEGGLRHSQEDYYGSFTGFNAGGVYLVESIPMEIRVTASRGYTAPPLSFRFMEISGFFAPNPDITLEEVMGYQAGVKGYVTKRLAFDVNGFYADVTDAISITENGQGLSYYDNFEKFRRTGVEAELRWFTSPGFTLFANTLQQEVRDLILNQTVKDKVRAAYSSGLKYRRGKWFSSVIGTYRDWNAQDKDGMQDKEWLWNIKAGYTHPIGRRSLQSVISVYNVSDVRLATNNALPQTPSRQFEATVKYLF